MNILAAEMRTRQENCKQAAIKMIRRATQQNSEVRTWCLCVLCWIMLPECWCIVTLIVVVLDVILRFKIDNGIIGLLMKFYEGKVPVLDTCILMRAILCHVSWYCATHGLWCNVLGLAVELFLSCDVFKTARHEWVWQAASYIINQQYIHDHILYPRFRTLSASPRLLSIKSQVYTVRMSEPSLQLSYPRIGH